MGMEFDNKNLVALVDSKFRNHREFGNAIGWSDSKVNYKLKSFQSWSVYDVGRAITTLGIKDTQIKRYFFTLKVQ